MIPSTGELTQKAGALGVPERRWERGDLPRRVARSAGPRYLTVTLDGKHMYVASEFSSGMTALGIASDETLSQIDDGARPLGVRARTFPHRPADGCADGHALAGPFCDQRLLQ